MRICKISDNYINYLLTKEPKILHNKAEKRPYIGVVLNINNYLYYVPLSSPKPKHKTMKNSKDFHKIKNGTYGAINFNKMIPVPNQCIINFNFVSEADSKYRALLQNQFKEINTSDMKKIIKNKTSDIYNIFQTPDEDLTPADLRVKQRCCNFKLLEQMCDNYNNQDTTK